MPKRHVPQFCGEKHCGKTGKGHFADALSELDDTIGGLMGSLTSHGVRDDTLVLVTGACARLSVNGAECKVERRNRCRAMERDRKMQC